ncbi:hypothetical protein AB6A40_007392 [Gnathostoma spinigerum]|uniref:FYVE-type domain-containing protein n=1 Tax=Gnathostoma spinigerum TaxID=75299 RepID=A0ABD6EUG5_9BILA
MGFTALHLALRSKPFLEDIFRILLKAGSSLTIPSDFNKATALHFLVDLPNSINLLEIAIDEQRDLSVCTCDDNGESPLARAVFHNHLSVAEKLLQAGCDVNETDHYGSSLLMRSFAAKLDAISVFLLSHGARVDITSKDGESCLELAVKYYLPSTVKHLCASGVNLNERNALTGLPPLWIALENGDFDIAKTMAEYGCDVNGWARSDDGICSQTMLHRAIDLNMHDAAIFLIESGCDVNAVKRYYNESLDDHQTPLHSCITWNLNDIANALIRMGASLTAQDSDGNTPVHIAIKEENSDMIDSLLSQCDTSVFLAKDRHGLNCFALAIQKRNDRAVRLIAERSPQVYLQTNRSGENLLHMAVRAADLESVLLLLGMQVDVNICVNNSMRTTALHICAQSGNEMIMRNLILAGASVNATSSSGLTPLHVAAYSDHAALCTILIENGADVNIVDKDGNTALHSAVSQGSVAAANVLLLQSDINARLRNKRHQTPLILAATCSSFSAAVEILQMFISVDPDYPVDSRDVDGNTLFLLSYMAGNAELCRAALGYTVCLAVTNNYGVSVFSYETPTKQLLFSLLDNLEKEPKWADGDFCSECEAKFNITMRKHHCRHCGRLVCSRCSEQTMPILKYGLEKAVRICQICFDVLTMGPTC